MLRSNVKSAFRSIQRNKFSATITVVGLSLSLAYCLLTFLYVQNEWSYDTFHQHHKTIYRLTQILPDALTATTTFAPELKPKLDWVVPDITHSARFFSGGFLSDEWDQTHLRFKVEDRSFDEEFLLTDSSFFDMFSFALSAGQKDQLVKNKQSIVIGAEAAQKLFGDENPMGKIISVRNSAAREWFWSDFKVTGVLKKYPSNSSIQAQFIMPFDAIDILFEQWMRRPPCDFYVQLLPQAILREVENKIAHEVDAFNKEMRTNRSSRMPALAAASTDRPLPNIRLQPLRDLHLSPHVGSGARHGITPPGDRMYSFVLAGLCLALLVIATINYIHITLGCAMARLKDVGVRKVIGASRRQITQQVLVETLVVALISLTAGILLAFLLLPMFNAIVDRSLVLSFTSTPIFFASLAFVVVIGLFAGSYPALLFSGFQPVFAIKNETKLGGREAFSHILMGLQFSFSILLITATIIMTAQLEHIQHEKTLGFDKEQLVLIRGEQLNWQAKGFFLNKLNDITTVEKISVAPSGLTESSLTLVAEESKVEASFINVDSNFVSVMGLDLLAGNNFSAAQGSGSTPILATQSFVEHMGWPNPIGQQVKAADPFTFSSTQGIATVVGVVNDFMPNSLQLTVKPVVLTSQPTISTNLFLIKIRSGHIRQTIKELEQAWASAAPECLFRFSFMDDQVEHWYRDVTRWSRLILYTAVVVLSIACLGIIGLLTLALSARSKEIGIRKICGATICSLFLMITKRFVYLISITGFIVAPVSWIFMQKWLQHFSIKIELNALFFIAPILVTLLFVLAVISTQAMKAATANPVESLRYE